MVRPPHSAQNFGTLISDTESGVVRWSSAAATNSQRHMVSKAADALIYARGLRFFSLAKVDWVALARCASDAV